MCRSFHGADHITASLSLVVKLPFAFLTCNGEQSLRGVQSFVCVCVCVCVTLFLFVEFEGIFFFCIDDRGNPRLHVRRLSSPWSRVGEMWSAIATGRYFVVGILKGFVVARLRRLFWHDLQETVPPDLHYRIEMRNQNEKGAVSWMLFRWRMICTSCS